MVDSHTCGARQNQLSPNPAPPPVHNVTQGTSIGWTCFSERPLLLLPNGGVTASAFTGAYRFAV